MFKRSAQIDSFSLNSKSRGSDLELSLLILIAQHGLEAHPRMRTREGGHRQSFRASVQSTGSVGEEGQHTAQQISTPVSAGQPWGPRTYFSSISPL